MKFGGSVDVDQPLEKTAALFANPGYLKEYQDGFLRKELISGTEGEDGAVSKMYYQHGKQEMELTETITENNLPHSFEAFYHHKHMDNTLKTTFKALSDTQTRYTAEGEYLVFRGFIPKMMAALFPKLFSKQAQKWMDNFKAFAEKQQQYDLGGKN
jgi:hypothetical protein